MKSLYAVLFGLILSASLLPQGLELNLYCPTVVRDGGTD